MTPRNRDGFRRACGNEAIYRALREFAKDAAAGHESPRDRLLPTCDALWAALSPHGLSWIGFYLLDESTAWDRAAKTGQLCLAERRDTPACSPIGLHGVCGQAFLEERIRLVEDVALLDEGYIACDPRDRSELVVPIYRNGSAWGVLDADSHEPACFGETDVQGFAEVLRAAGLLDRNLAVRSDLLQRPAGSL